MTSVDNYDRHILIVDTLKAEINLIKRKLIEMDIGYKDLINSSETAGFMADYTEQLKRKHQRFSAKIEALAHCIESHTAKLEHQKEVIYSLKDRARNSEE